MKHKPEDNELYNSIIHQLTTALSQNQFIAIALNQTLNRVKSTRDNRFLIKHYDHTVTRYMEDTPHENNPNTYPQLTEIFFIKSEYLFHLDSTKKKFDNIIADSFANNEVYEPFFKIFNRLALTFNFLKQKERDIQRSNELML